VDIKSLQTFISLHVDSIPIEENFVPIGTLKTFLAWCESIAGQKLKFKLQKTQELFLKFRSTVRNDFHFKQFHNMLKEFGANWPIKLVREIFDNADMDGDGRIDFNEFFQKLQYLNEFIEKDVEGKGKITFEAFSKLQKKSGQLFKQNEMKKYYQMIFDQIDTDKDGGITYFEFWSHKQKVLKPMNNNFKNRTN
jgi:Ca2+-binding EF-hand superfamily protein